MNSWTKENLQNSLMLYAVTDKTWLNGKTLAEQVEQTLKGGATFVQLREKCLDYENFLIEAIQIKRLCLKYKVPFIINDNVAIAKEVDADGVHVGQCDMTVSEARLMLGEDKIVGVSAQTVEQAIAAEKGGADYIGVGAMFPTNTKNDAESVSIETLSKICDSVSIPVVAIGGISKDNIEKLNNSGICGIAVVSAIFAQPDICEATIQLKSKAQQLR